MHVCDYDIATVPTSAIHHASAIVNTAIFGHEVGYRCPIAFLDMREEAVSNSGCLVLQPSRRRLKFVEAGKGSIEICLVEDLEAAEPITFDSENARHVPLGVEALWR